MLVIDNVILDVVFSLASVITAIGMVDQIPVILESGILVSLAISQLPTGPLEGERFACQYPNSANR